MPAVPATCRPSSVRTVLRPIAGAVAVALAVSSSQPGIGRPAAAGEFDAPVLLFAIEVAEPGVPMDHLVLIFDEIIDPDSIPAASDFAITFDATNTTVTPTAIEHVYSGFGSTSFISAAGLSFLKLTLPVSVTTSDDLSLDYTPDPTPGANRIRDLAGNETPVIPDFQVIIADPDLFADLDHPEGAMDFAGGVIDGDHGADTILLFFNRPIDPASLPALTDFSVEITDSETMTTEIVTPASVSLFRPDINIGMLDLTLSDPVTKDQQVVLDYTPDPAPDANRIRSIDTDADAGAIVHEPITVVLPTVVASQTFGEGGGTVGTGDGNPPTVRDPMATTVTSTAEGLVSIAESRSTDTPPTGYFFFGQQIGIIAPDAADAQHPIIIRFVIDASIVPPGKDEFSIVIARDGEPFTDNCFPTGEATPSPCIDHRSRLDGDISITVLTLEASTWNLAIPVPIEAELGAVAAELRAIADGNPGPTADKLEDALEKVEQSLAEFAKTPPDRVAGLGNVEGAAGDLEAVIDDGLLDAAAGDELMDRMSIAALALAEEAIVDAESRGADPSKIAQAKQARDQGDALGLAGRYKTAIAEYRHALSTAEGA